MRWTTKSPSKSGIYLRRTFNLNAPKGASWAWTVPEMQAVDIVAGKPQERFMAFHSGIPQSNDKQIVFWAGPIPMHPTDAQVEAYRSKLSVPE